MMVDTGDKEGSGNLSMPEGVDALGLNTIAAPARSSAGNRRCWQGSGERQQVAAIT
jgi:hypothetical protein